MGGSAPHKGHRQSSKNSGVRYRKFPFEFLITGSKRLKIKEAIYIDLGYLLEFQSKTLLLKAPHTLGKELWETN